MQSRTLTPRNSDVSVIIPVRDGREFLARTLGALFQSTLAGFECIVVDDASADDSGAIAEAFGCRVLRSDVSRGPAFARNLGAGAASGKILVFLDADVCVHRETLERLCGRLRADLQLAAVFGSYDLNPLHRAFFSQFRNLLHTHVHQTGNASASTFWTACGAVHRHWFERVGGFAAGFTKPSIEDIDVGYRIKFLGGAILLDRNILVTHQKRWRVWSTIKTDVLHRAAPWTKLILQSGRCPDDLNLKISRRISTILICISPAVTMLLAGLGYGLDAVSALLLMVAISTVINVEFYSFLIKARGFSFAVACFPAYLLFQLNSGIGLIIGVAQFALSRLAGQIERGAPQPVTVELSGSREYPPNRARAATAFGAESTK